MAHLRIMKAKLSESISAFGNTAGGELFVGIAEGILPLDRYWRGFSSMEAGNGIFQVLERLAPIAGSYAATWLTCPDVTGA